MRLIREQVTATPVLFTNEIRVRGREPKVACEDRGRRQPRKDRKTIVEVRATTMSDYVLIDMAVIAFANAMRVQSIIGNTALVLEADMFCQPTLQAKWRKEYGLRPENLRGLTVDEHVKRLRETLLPQWQNMLPRRRQVIL